MQFLVIDPGAYVVNGFDRPKGKVNSVTVSAFSIGVSFYSLHHSAIVVDFVYKTCMTYPLKLWVV
jgi:hypothetical protein